MLSLALVACAADTAQEDEADGADTSDLTSSLHLGTGATTFSLRQASARDVTLTVDCRPPADPDDVGPVFELSAPSMGIDEPARAGYLSRTGKIPAGRHTLTFQNLGAATSCTIRTKNVRASATCRSSIEYRSPNTNHTHFRVGTDASADWEEFPASGNHWGAWAPWSKVYAKPIKRGFLLHNLEHGGLVFSYKCASDRGEACTDARDKLVAIAEQIGARVIVTPDPTQPEMFAIRGWRYVYASSCLDEASALAFARAHYRGGREDADADPPIPFDPTTTNVPCENLMAAPDSCAR